MGLFSRKNDILSLKAKQRRWQKLKPMIGRGINLLFFGCACYGLVLVYEWLHHPTTFPLTQFKVTTDADYVKPVLFRQVVEGDTHAGFFSFDIRALKRKLEKNQWVRAVSIRKVFPHTLSVDIKERRPVAYWNDNGMVDEQHQIFYPQHMPMLSLPRFRGDKERLMIIQQRYSELNPLFAKLNVSINQLSYSMTGGWVLQLSNGIELHCGNKDVGFRCQRFITAYPQLKQANKHMQSVDLRYPSGFAVRWVDDSLTKHV